MTSAFVLVATWLLLGVALRSRFRVFQFLYIPASVIAGTLGLLFLQACQWFQWNWPQDCSATLGSWPGWLIAVVFAGMLLERRPASFRESLSRVGREGLMVWIIAIGQTAIGMLITWLVVQSFYQVPNSFGMLIETGFAGGHGTAAAMGQVFGHPGIDLGEGLDLGILMATCGLVYGLVSGIVWVNLGVRAGWVQSNSSAAVVSPMVSSESTASVPIGYAKIRSDTIDPLLLQVIWLTLAFAIGIALQWGAGWLAGWAENWNAAEPTPALIEGELSKRLGLRSIVESFPLFIYTLFGGLAVRRGLRAIGQETLIDRETINRLTSTAMDILVVSAVATLNLSAVATLIVPFSLLFLGGAMWSGLCLLVFSRWLLPREHWFELGLINYGMSTGTTATGFVLLRLVDPELESGAAEDYALAAPLSSPFVGGGMVTVGLPLIFLERFSIVTTTVALWALVAMLLVIGTTWNARRARMRA